MKSTVKIPIDKRHRHQITLPIELWNGLNLVEGELIELNVERIGTARPANVPQIITKDTMCVCGHTYAQHYADGGACYDLTCLKTSNCKQFRART